jgi:hypothetical protein
MFSPQPGNRHIQICHNGFTQGILSQLIFIECSYFHEDVFFVGRFSADMQKHLSSLAVLLDDLRKLAEIHKS